MNVSNEMKRTKTNLHIIHVPILLFLYSHFYLSSAFFGLLYLCTGLRQSSTKIDGTNPAPHFNVGVSAFSYNIEKGAGVGDDEMVSVCSLMPI